MRTFLFKDHYRVDTHGFLLDAQQWDEEFARAMASSAGITGELTEAHWKALHFIRNTFDKMTTCPLLYIAFQKNDLGLGDLKELFPTGYLKGACKLAGISYREAKIQQTWIDEHKVHYTRIYERKQYPVDDHGYLRDPSDWDEFFALRVAGGMHVAHLLTDAHWRVIYFLRKGFIQTQTAPKLETVADALGLSKDAIAGLFPDGFERGALRIAGLKNGMIPDV
ncbi:MAG: TusE/DsrC/DsvC family sulfur relay protein [candidate division Zixibacteria bacterium]|nr:TusE/DsrC/DsvC family sulfur relay protein [candidate division Zixibacteria bacterium]